MGSVIWSDPQPCPRLWELLAEAAVEEKRRAPTTPRRADLSSSPSGYQEGRQAD
jgi:hypothetical protein